MSGNKTICLCMMVRNESQIIKRALESALPYIDYWVITDTGSTDHTATIITETMKNVPGKLHHCKWVNFGHNRTVMVQNAKGKADYLLIMDADMVLNVYAPFKHLLTADAYEVRYEGDESYTQHMLIAAHHDWRYIGVTHEFIDAPTRQTVDWIEEISLSHFGDGGMRKDKFERDIVLLEEDLKKDPGNPRSIFYLAQSYKDIDKYDEALHWYGLRAAMEGTWEEERWFAALQMARIKVWCSFPWDDTMQTLLKAFTMRPGRIEPIYLLVKALREQGNHALAWTFCAFVAKGIKFPSRDILFIDRPVYNCLMELEYAVCAYYNGFFADAVATFNALLRKPNLPADVRDSALRGRRLSLDELFPPLTEITDNENRIVVITAFGNAGQKLKDNVRGMLSQSYRNAHFIYIDDASTDGCAALLPGESEKLTIINNTGRRGHAACIHDAIAGYCSSEDIVMVVSVDDKPSDNQTLSLINDFYNRYGCSVMGSRVVSGDGEAGFIQPFATAGDLRELRFQHKKYPPAIFRAGLYHSIENEDPAYDCLKNDKGRWLNLAYDMALTAALAELAGAGNVRYSDDVLFDVKRREIKDDDWLQASELRNNLKAIARKRPFAELDNYAMPGKNRPNEVKESLTHEILTP